MRQRLTIILTFVVIIGLLVLLNTRHLRQGGRKTHDMEIAPNRSTYHSGPTGTRALHDFLNESGYKVIRWRETPESCWAIPAIWSRRSSWWARHQIPFTDDEAKALLTWVARGGRFVLIDRDVDTSLVPKSGGWSVG